MHRLEQSDPHHLRNPARVVAVGLVDLLRLQQGFHVAGHNALFHQVRQAFVIGAYYPALVGACALGERILNHLMLDMRGHFTATPEYKKVYRKDSFDDWRLPIDTLEAWGILLPDAVIEYRALMDLRHRSIHFNRETTNALRDDALAAIIHMRTIIEQQFARVLSKQRGSHFPIWLGPAIRLRPSCFVLENYV